jgi:hypothetical protein
MWESSWLFALDFSDRDGVRSAWHIEAFSEWKDDIFRMRGQQLKIKEEETFVVRGLHASIVEIAKSV